MTTIYKRVRYVNIYFKILSNYNCEATSSDVVQSLSMNHKLTAYTFFDLNFIFSFSYPFFFSDTVTTELSLMKIMTLGGPDSIIFFTFLNKIVPKNLNVGHLVIDHNMKINTGIYLY